MAISAYAEDFDSRPPAPESWLYSAASVNAEHPLGCRWHDAGVSGSRSEGMPEASRGTLLLYAGLRDTYACPEFRRFAKDRGCESPDHRRSIRIEPQNSYTMNAYLGASRAGAVPRLNAVKKKTPLLVPAGACNQSPSRES